MSATIWTDAPSDELAARCREITNTLPTVRDPWLRASLAHELSAIRRILAVRAFDESLGGTSPLS